MVLLKKFSMPYIYAFPSFGTCSCQEVVGIDILASICILYYLVQWCYTKGIINVIKYNHVNLEHSINIIIYGNT